MSTIHVVNFRHLDSSLPLIAQWYNAPTFPQRGECVTLGPQGKWMAIGLLHSNDGSTYSVDVYVLPRDEVAIKLSKGLGAGYAG